MMKRRFALYSIMGAVLLMALAAGQTTVEAAENTARAERPVLIPHTKFVFEIEGRGTRRREYLKKEGGFLIFKDSVLGLPIYTIGLVLLYIAAFLTLLSMVQYLLAAWPRLKE